MRRVLALLLCLAAAVSCSGEDARQRRLLIVGWDGASFREIDRLIAAGHLPHLASAMERGAQARLESTVIPISSAAWTSAVTGKGPGDTGVYTFFEPIEGSYDVRLVSSLSNRAAPLWRILTTRGRRSIVFGVPLTYPPEPILGTMVAGMLSPFTATYAWPPELTGELRRRGFEPDLDVWVEARPVDGEDVAQQLAIKEEVLLELLSADDWEFAMVVFKSLDVISHLTYGVDFSAEVEPVYRRLDEILGALLAEVGDETDLLVISDHGFHAYPYGLNLHAWLMETGYSVRKEKVKRFTIRETAPLGERERQVVRQLRNELDFSRTRAFAMQSEGNFGGVRVNLVGREPEGVVPRGELEAVLRSLEADLRRLVDENGEPLVTDLFRGGELYPGPFSDALIPDLFFETQADCQVFSDPEEGRILGPYAEVVPDHDRFGILVAAGPSFRQVEGRGFARIADVAPTALHVMGLPVLREMTGDVRTELLSLERPVEIVSEAEDAALSAVPRRGATPFTEEELREIRERLEGLGYGE